jgi:sporulation protein YlmC with PRC-barrel domain
LALEPRTAVYASDGEQVGKVTTVLADEREDVFDGLVIETARGSRFIDGPDVARIAEDRVDLALTVSDVFAQPEHGTAGRQYHVDVPRSRLQDLWRRATLRGPWRKG